MYRFIILPSPVGGVLHHHEPIPSVVEPSRGPRASPTEARSSLIYF
jgi:hypothetical protein